MNQTAKPSHPIDIPGLNCYLQTEEEIQILYGSHLAALHAK
jgi:hypothetical protein